MQPIERAAEVSVARGCGFAALGIFTFMIGLMGEPRLAFQTGGILTLVTCLVLVARAVHAPNRFYKRTEVWLMLEADDRPHSETAQQLIGTALRDVYLHFAFHAACLSAAQLLAAVFIAAVPLRP